VNKELTDNLKCALKSYSERHPKKLYPDHFIIYRDGVGDGMRQQVLATEVSQFRAAISDVYNKAAKKPKITLIIVNKRITQRFFVDDGYGNLSNPPSGCIIDSGLVERQDISGVYDFFLIPQNTTQGCVLPTHFYVAYDDSTLTKNVVEKFTFALCHYYYNWAGPIKVPAPCMYAHKIAELFMNLGENKVSTDVKTKMSKYVCESLHFL
jgi:aubergine-like protein